MGMSSSQPQPVTQGTMGSPAASPPAKNYGPIGGMVNGAQNQVNPQSSPTQFTPGQGGMSGGMMPTNYTAPQQNGPTQFTPGQGGMSGGMMPTNYQVAQTNPMGNAGFMPMGTLASCRWVTTTSCQWDLARCLCSAARGVARPHRVVATDSRRLPKTTHLRRWGTPI